MLHFIYGLGFGLGVGSFFTYHIYKNISVEDVKSIHNALEQIHCHSTIFTNITKYLPKGYISWIETFKFYCEQIYIRIEQSIQKNCVKVGKNVYQISYVIDNRLYKILVSPIRGPHDINEVKAVTTDDNEVEITNDFLSFMDGLKSTTFITPEKLGYKFIYVKDNYSEKPITFYSDEVINF